MTPMTSTQQPARVLILGGTTEARRLAEALRGQTDLAVTSSLAGRVANPRLPVGEVRIGGFGGVAGLASWLAEHAIRALIDATHPFASTISQHAVQAAAASHVPLLALRRPAWVALPGDRWVDADSVEHAATVVPHLGDRIFLTIGRLGVGAFAGLPGWFLIRTVDPPDALLPAHHTVLLARGPYTIEGERELLRDHRIDVVVTKNSGGGATCAKLAAARELAVPVVMIRRPPVPDGVATVGDLRGAVGWLEAQIGRR